MKRRTAYRPLLNQDSHCTTVTAKAFVDGFLLSTPHPALRATFPASRRRGTRPP